MLDTSAINAMQISQSKILADGLTYFSLFDKHIPNGLTDFSKVLIYDISNYDCILRIMAKNPKAMYFIYGNSYVNDALKDFVKAYTISFLDETMDKYNIDMKFDCIIMNPPYSKNLHLKILAEAIKHLKDEKSVCVNLSPVRWLQDPLAKYKKNSDYHRFEESVSKHLVEINVINKINAQLCFDGTVMGADLGVYVCKSKNGNFNYDSLVNPILIKVLAKHQTKIPFDMNEYDGIRVRFPLICNNGGSGVGRKISMSTFGKMLWFENGFKDNKPWYDWYMHNQYTKTTNTIPCSVKFSTIDEAENFCKQFDTSFGKVYTHLMKSDVNVTPDIVLWMGDSINPRTGKKGYESEWTDEDFVLYFNITPEEQKMIEETMAKYK